MPRRALSRAALTGTSSLLALGVALAAPLAQAQIAKEESVLNRVGGKDYAPDVIQIGAFIVSPRVEVGAEYDDNVFRTKHGRKDDIRVHVNPSISIVSDNWDPINFSLGASADVGRYIKYSGENYEAFQTNAGLTYAINDEWSWGLNGTAGRSLARRGLDIDESSSKPTLYWFYTGQTDLIYQGDPFAFRFSPVYRRYDFKDSGGVNQDDRDRHEYELGGRFAYKIGANTSIFIDPSYLWVKYDSPVDDFGHNRNSEAYDIRVGVGYDASEMLYLEAGVGYFHRTFQDHAFKPASGVSALARFYWNPTDTLSFQGMVSRGISESDAFVNNTVNSGTAVTTGAELRVGWLAADNVLLDAGGGWYNFNYNVLSRKDNFYLFDAGARYYLNRNLYTGLRYYFERRRSNDSTLDYNDNRVMILIGGQL